jgi:hypothetical protein
MAVVLTTNECAEVASRSAETAKVEHLVGFGAQALLRQNRMRVVASGDEAA